MRFLLIAVFALLPLTIHAQNVSTDGADPATPSDRMDPEEFHGNQEVVDQLWTLGNSYRPTSATNFEAFASPLIPKPDVNDRSRLSRQLAGAAPGSGVYGHFGNPLFPDSIKSRTDTDHPYAMDSATNLYGRSWWSGGR